MAPLAASPTTARVPTGALIVAGVLIAYLPAIFGGFIWDDDSYLTENMLLREPGGLQRIWFEPRATPQYYPLVFTTFWIEHRLWGLHPLGYHLVNVLLHAASSVLLYRLLRGLAVPGAWLAAAIFALHPVHVESVAWITERKNVLSGFFYIAAAQMYLRFAGLLPRSATVSTEAGAMAHQSAVAAAGKWRDYAISLALFGCALLSKTVTCTMPAAMLVVIWWKRGRITMRDALAAAPMLLFGAAMGGLTAWLEKTHVGTGAIDWQLSPVDRCLIAGRALWFYLGKLVVPSNLCFFYPRWSPDDSQLWQYLFPAAWVALVAALFLLRLRIGRGPLAATLFFSGTLLPALGFVDVFPFRYSFVADHFQYLASIGPLVLFAAIIASRLGQATMKVIVVAICLLLGALTFVRSVAFMEIENLWRDTLATNERAWAAHQNLGVILDRRGESEAALKHFHRVVELQPDEYQTYMNISIALSKQGKMDEALAAAQTAIDLQPRSALARFNMGTLLVTLKRDTEAIKQFEAAIGYRPAYAAAHFNLGVVYERNDRVPEALTAFQQAINADPGLQQAWMRLASLQRRTGDAAAALKTLEAAAYRFPESEAIADALRQAASETDTPPGGQP